MYVYVCACNVMSNGILWCGSMSKKNEIHKFRVQSLFRAEFTNW